MKIPVRKLIALLLLVAETAALVYGRVSFSDYRNSAVGQVAGAAKKLLGSDNVGMSDIERNAIFFMIGGGACILVGGWLTLSRKKR